jgi:hypothetical protein
VYLVWCLFELAPSLYQEDAAMESTSERTGNYTLRRRDAAAFLTANGFPISKASLDCYATRGGGPAFRKFGRIPLYAEADLLTWANSKCSPVVRSTSELRAA